MNTNIIKKDINNLALNNNFLYCNNIIKSIEELKQESKDLIYARTSQFYNFFAHKILKESLAAGIIKYLLANKDIKVNLQLFRDNFKISASGISKAIKLLEDYMLYNK